MYSIEELASAFGTHNNCIRLWIDLLGITESEIEFSLDNFNQRQRKTMMQEYLRPSKYMLLHPELINHVQCVEVELIKALPEPVYLAHLAQLKVADKINDEINKRQHPYNNYDAQVFCVLRHVTKKNYISFVKMMFHRKISHSTYPAARNKLKALANQYKE